MKRKRSYSEKDYAGILFTPSNMPHISDEEFLGADTEKVADITPYDTYEALVLRKEQLLKDAGSFRISYLKEFGDLMAEILTSKLECVRLKKTISYCMQRINAGEAIDGAKMKAEIEGEMQAYYVELKDLVEQRDAALKSTTADEYSYKKTKVIFRRIAKRLHPDINAKTTEIPALSNLWDDVMIAYKAFDADKLEELEVVLNHIMSELGEEGFVLKIDDIEEKIKKVERQIQEITTTNPYLYGDLLCDKGAMQLKKAELEHELEEYHIYQLNLEETLEKLAGDGGAKFTWQITL